MRIYLELSPSPYEEDCAQLGREGYARKAQRECSALINQLRRLFGKEPDTAEFRVKGNAHDFGTYYEVVIVYDDKSEIEMEYAYHVEKNFPKHWDHEARMELKK